MSPSSTPAPATTWRELFFWWVAQGGPVVVIGILAFVLFMDHHDRAKWAEYVTAHHCTAQPFAMPPDGSTHWRYRCDDGITFTRPDRIEVKR